MLLDEERLVMFTAVDGGNNVLGKLVSHKEEKLERRRAHLPLYSWEGHERPTQLDWDNTPPPSCRTTERSRLPLREPETASLCKGAPSGRRAGPHHTGQFGAG
jgi:hypothetical protein